MTTSWESGLRDDLRKLADVPNPDSPADRALAGARKIRRGRGLLTGAATMTVTALIALPVIAGVPPGFQVLPFGSQETGAPCETTTDEADPPRGVPKQDYPGFVRDVLAKLPPRNDYTLQSSHGICDLGGHGPNGYAVVNLGPNREHGHLTVTVYLETKTKDCAAVRALSKTEILFCDEPSGPSPLVFGTGHGPGTFLISAVHADTRAVAIGLHGTPFDVTAMRTIIADPALVAALP